MSVRIIHRRSRIIDDDAKFLTSENPSSESQAFWNLILMIALKSLDIPLCFFNEGSSNWPGLRVAWIQYDQSAAVKRSDNREALFVWTVWQLTLAIIDGLLVEAVESQYIIPMAVVTENVELPRGERARNNGRNLVSVRGQLALLMTTSTFLVWVAFLCTMAGFYFIVSYRFQFYGFRT